MITASDEAIRQAIHRNLQRLLKKRKLKVSDLVTLTGEPPNTIYRISRGDNTPTVSTLYAIARALDTTVDFLISENLSEET